MCGDLSNWTWALGIAAGMGWFLAYACYSEAMKLHRRLKQLEGRRP